MVHSRAGDDEIPRPIDPENDVDGAKTAKWLIAWSIVFAISIWLSYVAFDLVSDDEISRKVENAPTLELDKLRADEKAELEAAGTRPSLDQAINKYTQR